MSKKQKKLLKIISMVILSGGSVAGTSTALIACNNNKETPFAIKTAIIDSTGTKITFTYDGNIPSDFSDNLKVIENTRNLTKDTDWTFDGTKTITLKNIDTAFNTDTLTVEYKNESLVTATNQSAVEHITSAAIDTAGKTISITFNGDAPSDFAGNIALLLNGAKLTKDTDWTFDDTKKTITLTKAVFNTDTLTVEYKNGSVITVANKSTIEHIASAAIDTAGKTISITFHGDAPSDFAGNIALLLNGAKLTKDTDWTFDDTKKTITLTKAVVVKGDVLTIQYKKESVVPVTNQSAVEHIASAAIDTAGKTISITFHGNAPDDFISKTIISLNGAALDKNNWTFNADKKTITLKEAATKYNTLTIKYNKEGEVTVTKN